MHPVYWVPPQANSLLDVGCNVGEFLAACKRERSWVRLVGVDVNGSALVKARRALPDVSLCQAEADALPFRAESFDCVTCIEVLEHVPEERQAGVLREIGRVLRTNGTLVLRVPHRGAFDWLDSNNLRFRFPRLYGLLVGRGRRDEGFRRGSADVVWHRHFGSDEILELLGSNWAVRAWRRGGLLIFPLGDIACWPFYRAGKTDNAVVKTVQRLMAFDIGVDYGRASFDLLGVFTKLQAGSTVRAAPSTYPSASPAGTAIASRR